MSTKAGGSGRARRAWFVSGLVFKLGFGFGVGLGVVLGVGLG